MSVSVKDLATVFGGKLKEYYDRCLLESKDPEDTTNCTDKQLEELIYTLKRLEAPDEKLIAYSNCNIQKWIFESKKRNELFCDLCSNSRAIDLVAFIIKYFTLDKSVIEDGLFEASNSGAKAIATLLRSRYGLKTNVSMSNYLCGNY